jgi:hypothetical protein
MKSPFANREVETYNYPAPLDAPRKDGESQESHEARKAKIDKEVLAEVRAHAKEHGSEALVWIKVRIARSKGDVDAVADYTQSMVAYGTNGDGALLKQKIAEANRGVFGLLVEGWSFTDDPGPDDYGRLDKWSSDWVSACLGDAVDRGTRPDFPSSAPTSSKRRAAGRTESPTASSSD